MLCLGHSVSSDGLSDRTAASDKLSEESGGRHNKFATRLETETLKFRVALIAHPY